jgi:hypothetical protein
MFDEPSSKRMAHIGSLCLQWSYLEYIIAAIIWKQLNFDMPVGKIVTGGLDMLPRLNMAINLCRELKTDSRIERGLVAARKALQSGLQDDRNMVVHGQHWLITGNAPSIEVQHGKGTRQPKIFTDQDIYKLVEDIAAVSNEIGRVLVLTGFIDTVNLSDIENADLSIFSATGSSGSKSGS